MEERAIRKIVRLKGPASNLVEVQLFEYVSGTGHSVAGAYVCCEPQYIAPLITALNKALEVANWEGFHDDLDRKVYTSSEPEADHA
jgi:hypothetical protein